MTRQTWSLLARRRAAQRAMNEQVEVWRDPTGTPDGQGGRTLTLARVATYPGTIGPVTERAALLAERLGRVATAVIFLPHDAAILPADQLRVGTARYAVIGTDVGTTDATRLSASVAAVR